MPMLQESTPTLETGELITVPEAARLAGVSTWSIHRWLRDEGLAAFKLVGTLRIRRADLNALLVRRKPKPTQEEE